MGCNGVCKLCGRLKQGAKLDRLQHSEILQYLSLHSAKFLAVLPNLVVCNDAACNRHCPTVLLGMTMSPRPDQALLLGILLECQVST